MKDSVIVTEELNLHPEDHDLLDSPKYDNQKPTSTPSSNSLLNTPSPLQDDLDLYLNTDQVQQVPPPPADRIRVDIFVSLRRHGQKIDPTRVPKTCVARFSVQRKPLAYKQADFYETAVNQARIELLKVPPFSNLVAIQGPWMPQLEFIKPSFKIPKTRDTCVYSKTYPNKNELLMITHSFDFGTEHTEPHQKLYIIFDVNLKSKFHLQKIKTEEPVNKITHTATDSEFNLATGTLIDNAEKVIQTMNVDISQANTDWYSALITYREQRQLDNTNLLQIHPRPYTQSLPEQEHAPALLRCTEARHLVNNKGQVKPNLQVQIKTTGGREVFHTPDTTGTPLATPQAMPSTESITDEMNPTAQTQAVQPVFGLTQEMLMNIIQQTQPAQQAQIPMHLRLGPKTPPLAQTNPPGSPKKRRFQSGQRAKQRKPRHQEFHNQTWNLDRIPRWNPKEDSQSDYRSQEEDDDRRPQRPRSRDAYSGNHYQYHNRDPRISSHKRGRPDSYDNHRSQPHRSSYDRQPERPYRPRSRTPTYDRHQNNRPHRHRSDSPPAKRPRPNDPEQMKDLAKILNIAPDKMNEVYDVIGKAIQQRKNN